MKHINLSIRGEVQGVAFRDSTLKKAVELDLSGFVRNEPDGSIYIEVEGDEKLLGQFVNWCDGGPPQARVESVSLEEGELVGFRDFEVH